MRIHLLDGDNTCDVARKRGEYHNSAVIMTEEFETEPRTLCMACAAEQPDGTKLVAETLQVVIERLNDRRLL